MDDKDVPSFGNTADGTSTWLNTLLSFIELQEVNFVILPILFLCCFQVNFFHGCVFVILLLGILMPGSIFQRVVMVTILNLMAALILSKMLYQTELFSHNVNFTCEGLQKPENLLDFVAANANWLGYNEATLSDLGGYYIVLAVTTILRAIHLRQKMKRIDSGVSCCRPRCLFPDITHSEADDGLLSAIKYLLNYGFYKFGLEISAIFIACVISFRRDVFVILYGLPLIVMLLIRRANAAKIWGAFVVMVSVCLLFEYLVLLGFHPTLCLELPWKDSVLRGTILDWLFLVHPNMDTSRHVLFMDTVMLAVIRRQYTVFLHETEFTSGGSNVPLSENGKNIDVAENPVHDHTTLSRPWLDHMKMCLFNGLYWVTMVLALVNGTTNGDVISLGNLWIAFTLLWEGSDLYLWTASSLVKRWNMFLGYNILVIMIRSTASVFACELIDHTSFPKLEIFTIMKCGNSYQSYVQIIGFACCLFQKRFFQSYYFLHHAFDAKASKLQESQGGALIRELHQRRLEEEIRNRNRILNKLKKETEELKELHKQTEKGYIEPKSHEIALRMGSYSMFEISRKPTSQQPPSRRQSGNIEKLWNAAKKEIRSPTKKTDKDSDDEDEYDWDDDIFKASMKAARRRSKSSKSSWRRKWFFTTLLFWEMLKNVMRDLVPKINLLTYNHRFVAWILAQEKADLKAKRTLEDLDDCSIASTIDTAAKFRQFETSVQNDDRAVLVIFIEALWNVFLTYADNVCYMAIFIHQTLVPSLMSLPLPLMTLLWGSLTKKGPTPTFWSTLIAYIEAGMIIKVLTKNFHITGSSSTTIIGIEESDQNTLIDIGLLLVFFIHKSRLKSRGLWYTNNLEVTLTPIKWQGDKSGKYTWGCLHSLKQHLENIKGFFRQLQIPPLKTAVDVYKYIFICDFFNMVFVFFAYAAFTPVETPQSSDYLVENNIPIPYALTLVLLFVVLLLNRALYLKRAILAKVIVQIMLVLLMHIWLFIGLPVLTERSFAYKLWTNVFYIINCISFLLSAYQIRNGSPLQTHENFVTKNYNYINYYCFKVLQFVPFFIAFKMMLDWMNTDTSMSMMQWFRMESIYSVVFESKCNRRADRDHPSERGERYPLNLKLIYGLLVVIILVIIFWCPLLIFAIFKSVSESTPPSEARLSLRLNNFDSLFTHSFIPNEIKNLDEIEYKELKADLKEKIPGIWELFAKFDYEEVYVCTLKHISDSSWQIAPGRLQELLTSLERDSELFIELDWQFKRIDNGVTMEEARVEGGKQKLSPKIQEQLAKAIQTKTATYFNVTTNKIFKILSQGQAVAYEPSAESTNVTVSLKFDESRLWWDIEGECSLDQFSEESMSNCKPVKIFIFSGKRVPRTFNFLSSKGILGLYLSVVFVAWTFIRRMVTNLYSDIIFVEMANVDPVLQLCNDIYLARANHEFGLEEDLYAKLLFLFRSPETMIKWTRLKKEDLL